MCMKLKPKFNHHSGRGKGLLNQTKARMNRSKFKVTFVVIFDWKGIFFQEFVPRCQMVNKQLYQEVVARLMDAVHRKSPELWEKRTSMLHHDNAPAHMSLLFRSYLQNIRNTLWPIHPILRT